MFECFELEKTGIRRLEDLKDLQESDYCEIRFPPLQIRKLKKCISLVSCEDSMKGNSPQEECPSGNTGPSIIIFTLSIPVTTGLKSKRRSPDNKGKGTDVKRMKCDHTPGKWEEAHG